jgi:uracil-DNA glycosylase
MDKILEFIDKLSKVEKGETSTNLYFGDNLESKIRRNNLLVYLTKMKTLNSTILFLGEAPGYKGCRLSGLAFTSEKILFENEFFANEDMQFINDRNKLESEISATIVWSEIQKLKITPLIWNIFPFHPHNLNDIKSNRTPTNIELEEGKVFLLELLKIFEIKEIVALGRKPQLILEKILLNHQYVRHPANGGKKDFIEGLSKFR